MARKPGRMYKKITQRSYTRREYMGGVPGSKLVTFDMGNLKDEFPIQLTLVAKEECQIRHSALESARIAANRMLLDAAGITNYHLKIRVYPHEVLRENKQATGAGADRVSQGMRLAFGKAIGTAARVRRGQEIMSVYTNPANFKLAKKSLVSAGYKLPTPISLVVEKGQELVLT
ncbi:MAG: 50S ribosomal protein L16 [Candidatus Methanoperedens sp.]